MSQAQVNATLQMGQDIRAGLDNLAKSVDNYTRVQLLGIIAQHGEQRIEQIVNQMPKGVDSI